MNNRWLAIGLAISLVFNVFILGAVAGAFGQRARLEHRPRVIRPQVVAMNPLMRAGDALPPDVRDQFRASMREQAAASRPNMEEARAARMEAADAFAAPKFDKSAAQAALARSRAAETAAREKLEAAVVDFAATLPADQRAGFAERLRQPPRMNGGRRGGGPGMGGPGMGGPGMGPGGPPPYEGGPEDKAP